MTDTTTQHQRVVTLCQEYLQDLNLEVFISGLRQIEEERDQPLRITFHEFVPSEEGLTVHEIRQELSGPITKILLSAQMERAIRQDNIFLYY